MKAAGSEEKEAKNTVMINDLISTLNAVGKTTAVYESPDGSKVLILPYGGRVLGLFASSGGENFLWTHPALDSVESARGFYQSGEWHNSGGDRTWLAPEVDLFFPNFPKLDHYLQPRQLDPGNYRLDGSGGEPCFVNELELKLSRTQHQVGLRISKAIIPALDPLRHERLSPSVEYAGYTLRTSAELLGAGASGPDHIGIWNLLQLPHGGDMWIPIYSKCPPKVIMGSILPNDLTVKDRHIQYRMRASGEHKIGIRAAVTTGRMGYLYQSAEDAALVIRNFFVNPSGEYVDVPWDNTGDFGYSIQACNIKSGLGSFSELEYHSPAIGGGTGRTCSVDESQVWAYRGDPQTIRTIAQRLLSPDI